MTDPKENKEIRDELSTEELKSVSGGLTRELMLKGNNLSEICDVGTSLRKPHGSGSGMTKADFERVNKTGLSTTSENLSAS